MMVGYRAAACRSHRASVVTLSTWASAAIPNIAHVQAPPGGDFVHGRSPQARACRGTCKWRPRPWAKPSRIPPAPASGRSPQTSCSCFDDINKFHQYLRGHFVQEQLDSRTCHSCGIYLDVSSFRGSTLRGRSLHDDALLHEVHHRWRRASNTTASSIIQNDFVAIC